MSGAAVAVGMFDGVHLGHQSLVRELAQCARERGLRACVITFARHPLLSIRPDAAPRLLTTPDQKAALLRQAGADEVIALDFTDELRRLTAREFMAKISHRLDAKAWLMGFNHRFGADGLRDFAQYQSIGSDLGVDVMLADRVVIDGMDEPVSSSLVRQAIDQGRIADANAMLGRQFAIDGIVEAGQQIGRTIGFPTANVRPLMPYQLIPKRGAYATAAIILPQPSGNSTASDSKPKAWPAMTNIGCRPTLGDGLTPTIETHVIGFDGNLYGSQMQVRFIARLRDEQKFPTLAALRRQLQSDLKSCLSLQN